MEFKNNNRFTWIYCSKEYCNIEGRLTLIYLQIYWDHEIFIVVEGVIVVLDIVVAKVYYI